MAALERLTRPAAVRAEADAEAQWEARTRHLICCANELLETEAAFAESFCVDLLAPYREGGHRPR